MLFLTQMAKHCYFALFFAMSYNLVLFHSQLCRFDLCSRSSDWTIWAGSLWSLSPVSLSPQSPASSSSCASPTKTLLSLEPPGGMRSGLASTFPGIFDFFCRLFQVTDKFCVPLYCFWSQGEDARDQDHAEVAHFSRF